MEWDLKLEKDGQKWVLYRCQGGIPIGKTYEWRDRTALIQSWLAGSDDWEFEEILENVPSLLRTQN
jgi:hypothetical protein